MKEGGFFSKGGPMIAKVPANDKEAIKSNLLGWNEKRKARNFFIYIQNWDPKDPKTWKGMDLYK